MQVFPYKTKFIDGRDAQQSGFIPVSQKTSLQPYKQRSSSSYQGPAQGQQGQYTGLTYFQLPEKYRKIMNQNPSKCKVPSIKGNQTFDPYLFKKSLDVYYGEWEKGKPHGYGKLFNPDRDFYYEGYFEGGLPSYYGVFLNQDIEYRGQIKYGRAQGNGTYKQGKTAIQGVFKQNNPYKNCIEKGHNYVFNGDYQNGKWSKGKLQWNCETLSYEGDFKQGLLDGQGTLKTADYVYKGQFKQGQKHGIGKIIWNTGEVYKGQFQHNQITGKGQLSIRNELIYKGELKQGMPHGSGWAFYNGKIIRAVWKQGDVQQLE